MHENLQVTDGVYGIFSNIGVQRRMIRLGTNTSTNKIPNDTIIDVLEEAITELEKM